MKKSSTEKILTQAAPVLPIRVVDSDDKKFINIIGGCRELNPDSQKKLYKKFYGYALGVALTYCPTRADADEVVNDCFMKVFDHIESYDTSRPFKPWLRKIVVNTSIDKVRANKRFKNQLEIEKFPLVSSHDVEAGLNAKQIYNMLNRLPDLLRFVFNMYEIEGYSHREIAQKLDIAESSSRTYLTRAKSQLRELYHEMFMERGVK